MKLLPKQAINTAKANERKTEIDQGLALAKKVDSLRELRVREEVNLKNWREEAIKGVHYEIGQLCEERDKLKIQNDEARKLRDTMLKPLDAEWLKIKIAHEQLQDDTDDIQEEKLLLELDKQFIENEKKKITKIASKTRINEIESEKARNDALSLKNLAQRDYEIAHAEKIEAEKICEQKMISIKSLEEQYRVGIETNEREEKMLKEKESELIIKEKDLTRRENNLRIAWQKINGNNNDTNDQQ